MLLITPVLNWVDSEKTLHMNPLTHCTLDAAQELYVFAQYSD